MASYELTISAAQDFENILEFGIDALGLNQALRYQRGMSAQFSKLADQPELFQAIDHILEGYRRSVYGAHSIYYRIEDQGVLIVRILGQQDTRKAFQGAKFPVRDPP